MRERGKQAVEIFSNNLSDFNFSAASEIPCKKHPNSSSVGICPHCLKDRLVKLVCSECGEQRLSSCSCSDVSSSYRNSCSTMEVGSVGRVSFLIENDKIDPNPIPRPKTGDKRSEQVIFLRRSASSCVEVKRANGFWRIKRLFRKKLKKGCDKNGEFGDDKSEIWVSDVMGVSRSRSLCSFRGFGANEFDDESKSAFSSAKISDVTGGVYLDPDRGYGELEPRKSTGVDLRGVKRFGGPNVIGIDRVCGRGVFPAKESDFSSLDESAFIDLKVDLSSSSECSGAARMSCGSDHGGEFGGGFANMRSGGALGNNMGSSCRVAVNERGVKRVGKSHSKVWKWIFKKNN